MADFADEFKTHLKTISDVTTLVGTGTSARIYPDMLRQGCTLPAIIYYETGGESWEYLGGIGGLRHTVMHVVAYGATRAAANELADTIRTKALNANFKGDMGTTHVSGINASEARSTGVDRSDDKSDTKRYWCDRIYDLYHVEATS